MVELPTFADVEAARDFVGAHLAPTPLVHCWQLSQLLECQYYAKCENLQPVGAFKVRGGVNLVSQLSDEEKRRGVATASTGNHGQSIAFACRAFGAQALIVLPENANPLKVAAMEALANQGTVRYIGVSNFDAIHHLHPDALAAVPAPRDHLYVRRAGGAPDYRHRDTLTAAPVLPPSPTALVTAMAQIAATADPGPAPAPLYIKPADAAPSRDAPPVLLDDA